MAVNPMRTRLEELRGDYETGRHRLEVLEHERQEVRDTVLRISGAIQVLEELLGQEEQGEVRLEQVS